MSKYTQKINPKRPDKLDEPKTHFCKLPPWKIVDRKIVM